MRKLGFSVLVGLVSVATNAATDMLDTNLTVRIALDQIERTLFCKDVRGVANKCAILRLIGEVERLLPWGLAASLGGVWFNCMTEDMQAMKLLVETTGCEGTK